MIRIVATKRDAGIHFGHMGAAGGQYDVNLLENGNIEVVTVLTDAKHNYTVTLSPAEWDAIHAWVKWQRAELQRQSK